VKLESSFQEIVNQAIGGDTKIKSVEHIGGGCINSSAKIATNHGSFFIKWNSSSHADMFQKEVKGLEVLQGSNTIDIPAIHGVSTIDQNTFLLLEWIEGKQTTPSFWADFGQRIAQLHRKSSLYFGLDHPNFIGSLDQSNTQHQDWTSFFISERIVPQLKLAESSRKIDASFIQKFDKLFSKLDELIPKESPSLLHGDLWSGNFLCAEKSKPVIFDPAIYFGHREMEIAFTYLFGGFDRLFYTSYQEEFPLEKGFEDRIEIHNLYPLLVHVNLFGTSYLSGIHKTLKRFT
jgi:protein-ribulosamine 3-kinase